MTLTQFSIITLGVIAAWGVRWFLKQELTRMKARAWDEGYKTAMFDREYYSHNRNPYRSKSE